MLVDLSVVRFYHRIGVGMSVTQVSNFWCDEKRDTVWVSRRSVSRAVEVLTAVWHEMCIMLIKE